LVLEQMTPALGWKMGHVYLALPIAGFFMVLFTIENLMETVCSPAGQTHAADGSGEVD
jgi:TRAP-type C4-dicarboxylate transport system permease small subunit